MTLRQPLVAAASALATLAMTAAQADTVTMRNGDRLSGTVLHMASQSLTLDTPYAGNVQLPWGEVTSVATDKRATLILKGEAGPREGRLSPSKPGYLVLGPDDPKRPAAQIALSRVRYVDPTPSESGSGVEYKGHVTLAASRVAGNSTGANLNGDAALEARAKSYRYELRGSVDQATLSGQTVTSNSLLSAHVDRFVVDQKHFQYLRASAERDRFRDLKLRSAVGGGYGWQLIDDGVTEFSVRGGLDLVAVDRYANPAERYPALGWGLQFSRWVWQHRIKLFHDQDGYWDLSHTGEVLLRTRTGLRVPIIKRLLATAELDVDWDRHPALGVKPTDSTLLLGLGYQW